MNEDEFYKRLAQAKGERDQAMRDYLEACRARDEAQRALSAEVQQLVKDRDFLRNHYSMEVAAMLRAELASARAEIEMLRGVGCREAKEGEPEMAQCGVCLKCAEERGAEWAIRAKAQVNEDEFYKRLVYAVAGDASYVMLAREVCEQARGKR